LAAALPAAIAFHLICHASQIHADIEDRREQGRGRPTVWSRIGVVGAIHAGDLILSLAMSEALRSPSNVLPCLLDAWRDLLDGRSLRWSFGARPPTSSEYRAMIQLETAASFRSALEIGAIVADAPAETVRRLASFGEGVGMAWAIRDDLLAVWGNAGDASRSHGEGPANHAFSYPWIAAHEAGSNADRRILEQAVSGKPTNADMDRLLTVFDRLAIRAETEDRVREHLQEAVKHLPYVPFSEPALATLTELFDGLTGFDG
jgi:geranylgeranyl pyrophosphate synthase